MPCEWFITIANDASGTFHIEFGLYRPTPKVIFKQIAGHSVVKQSSYDVHKHALTELSFKAVFSSTACCKECIYQYLLHNVVEGLVLNIGTEKQQQQKSHTSSIFDLLSLV